MDVKAVIKKMLKAVPDKYYLELYYFAKFKKRLNLRNPKTFNEKLQWLKLHDRKPEYTEMVDKYEAKRYVARLVGEEYIIPTIGVYERFEDIDFDRLPEKFVLKCTHDSGGLYICRNRKDMQKAAAQKTLERSLENNYYYSAREWPYKNVKPRIIAEPYMEDQSQKNGLTDYKFYCFNGKPRFLYVSKGMEDHATASISFLNLNWTFAPFQRGDYRHLADLPEKPADYDTMLWLAEMLSKGTSFLRVDLYEINNQVFFSELTFTPCGGTMRFEPEAWDATIGSWIDLPTEME